MAECTCGRLRQLRLASTSRGLIDGTHQIELMRGVVSKTLPLERRWCRNVNSARYCPAAFNWGYGGYGPPRTASEWTGYPDPRAAPAGPQRQPPSQPDVVGPSPTSSYDGEQVLQEADPLSDLARSGVEILSNGLAFLAARLSDAVLSLLPPHVKRRAVENTVKGGLALLGLALLQSVLSFVLTVGTVALLVYAAHQVFGVQLPFLPPAVERPPTGQEGESRQGTSGPSYSSGASTTGGGNSYQADPRTGGYAGPRPPYDPYHRAYNYAAWAHSNRGQAYYRPPPGGPSGPGTRGRRGTKPQGPTIDVHYESM